MPLSPPESVDTRILPKYTLYIGPKSPPQAGTEASGPIGIVLQLAPCTTEIISSEEQIKIGADINCSLAKGEWVRVSSSAWRPYRVRREFIRWMFSEATFIERITINGLEF